MINTNCLLFMFTFKGQSHVTVIKRYLNYLHCFPHVSIVFCTNFGGRGESRIILLLEVYRYLCNLAAYEYLFVSLRSSKVYLQNNPSIWRKLVENQCGMAYQKSCNTVVSFTFYLIRVYV